MSVAELQYLDFQIPVFFEWEQYVKYKIVTKGRRTGITKGAANAFIEYMLDFEGPLLWGDTIHANIDRYFQRYFLPELKHNRINYQWESQKKQLTINGQFCDFRSADNPENWEGFGYNYIFLNEAGIILKNKELYVNTVLPMLLDYPDSKLIAAGVPKGKLLKDGTEHPFYTLAKRAEDIGNYQRYRRVELTTYHNPLLAPADIKELEEEMEAIGGANAVRQEVYGEFVEMDAINPFAFHFNPIYHVSEEATFRRDRRLYISLDFNLNPFAVTFWHYWQDTDGHHLHGIDEAEIGQGSIPAMIELIKSRYSHALFNAILTGDSMGNNRDIGRIDNASHYIEMMKGLNLAESQLQVPHNPTHENSRADCNALLFEATKPVTRFHVKLHPVRMRMTINDLKVVQCDATGQILKRDRHDLSQRADYLDGFRAIVNLVFKKLLVQYRNI